MNMTRKQAAKLNSLIDETSRIESLDRIRDMLFLLQDINAQGLEVECKESHRAVFHILYLMQNAIDFELQNEEASHG